MIATVVSTSIVLSCAWKMASEFEWELDVFVRSRYGIALSRCVLLLCFIMACLRQLPCSNKVVRSSIRSRLWF